MKKHPKNLREKALSLIKDKPERINEINYDDINKIIEELNVYQIELEIKNKELRNTQLNLEKTSARYRDLFESSPTGYIIINYELNIIDCNTTFANIVRDTKERIVQKNISRFIHPDFQDQAYLCFNKLFKDQTKASCEIKVRIKDQKPEYYRIDGIMQADLDKKQLAGLTFTNIHKDKEN